MDNFHEHPGYYDEPDCCDGAFLEEVEDRWEFQHTIDAYTFPRLLKLAKMSDQLGAKNKWLKETVEEAKVKRGQYREIIEALLVPTNFIGIEAARSYILEALEYYGLAKVTKS